MEIISYVSKKQLLNLIVLKYLEFYYKIHIKIAGSISKCNEN
jgi:hypothetical protein